jgi:hypothetical protein
MPHKAMQARGVIMGWDCLNMDYDLHTPPMPKNIGLHRKYIFATPDEARKAVFKIKLKEA